MSEKEYLIETMTIALANKLVKNHDAQSIQEAIKTVYNSETYSKMCDERSGLMFQNPGYVYCFLKDELTSI